MTDGLLAIPIYRRKPRASRKPLSLSPQNTTRRHAPIHTRQSLETPKRSHTAAAIPTESVSVHVLTKQCTMSAHNFTICSTRSKRKNISARELASHTAAKGSHPRRPSRSKIDWRALRQYSVALPAPTADTHRRASYKNRISSQARQHAHHTASVPRRHEGLVDSLFGTLNKTLTLQSEVFLQKRGDR